MRYLNNIFVPALTVMICISALSLQRALADELFPSPIIQNDRTIAVVSPRTALPLETDSPVRAYVFRDAIKSCKLNIATTSTMLKTLLTDDSAVYKKLDLLFESSAEQIEKLSLTILIDDFGDKRKFFNSIYLPQLPDHNGPVILLDCSIAAREYWRSSIAHEFTHALLNGKGIDSWFEEGLAQLMEEESGGVQPIHETDVFRNTTNIPTLIEQRRPLPSGANYAITYLFLKYLKANFGDWPILRAMIGMNNDSVDCSSVAFTASAFYGAATCRGKVYLEKTPRLSKLSEKMTPLGLFRFFAVAATLNTSAFSLYAIPGWGGFTKKISPTTLQPFSFGTYEPKLNYPTGLGLESYWVANKEKSFTISQEKNDSDSFLLIVNPTAEEIAIH